MLKPEYYFDLDKFKHADIFTGLDYVWDVLKRIEWYLRDNLKPGLEGEIMDGALVGEDVYIGKGTVVEPGAMIKGPTIIGDDCEIRHGAYIRGGVIVGDGVVIGNSTELKVSLLFDEVEVPHYNYVGDSVMGWKSHLGAGAIISNYKLTGQPISVNIEGEKYENGLVKFGAIIGDKTQIGCNAVLNPGSMLGRNCILYNNVSWRGNLPSEYIVKLRQEQELVEKKK